MIYEVSVIIPTCNKRYSTLKVAVSSVLLQDLDNIEVVIVDDNAEDCTDVLMEMFSHIGNISISRNDAKHSAAAARNHGVSIARGKYITFLDDDDMYLPGRLSSMLKHFSIASYTLVSSGRFNEVNNFSEIKLVKYQKYGVIDLNSILFGNDIDIGFMMLRKKFLDLGGFDVQLESLEDWDFIIRALKQGVGYKQKRLDYVVNRSLNVKRVSDKEAQGYIQLKDKISGAFGSKWAAFMHCTSLRLSCRFSVIDAISLTCKYKTMLPIKNYLAYVVKRNA